MLKKLILSVLFACPFSTNAAESRILLQAVQTMIPQVPPVIPAVTNPAAPATTVPATPATTKAAAQTTQPPQVPAVSPPAPGTTQAAAQTTPAQPVTTLPPQVPAVTTQAAVQTTAQAAQSVTTQPATPATTKAATTAQPALPTEPALTVTPPAGYAFGAHDQLCAVTSTFAQSKCVDATQSASDQGTGQLYCDAVEADCCMCDSISCGEEAGGRACNQLRLGDRGAFGVKDVRVRGAAQGTGAMIYCHGTESCRNAQVVASQVDSVNCNGYRSCDGAVMVVTDPKANFMLDCTGYAACENLEIQINYSGPPPGYMCAVDKDPSLSKDLLPIGSIECENEEACRGMRLTINNEGCASVRIGELRCLERDSCAAADFDLIGDVSIGRCQCGPSCADATGLAACFQNLAKVECMDAQSCMGQQRVITNPLNGFEFTCGNEESCRDAQVRFEFTQDADKPRDIERMNGLVFGGVAAGMGAVFVFDNQQGLKAPAVEGAQPEPVWLTVNKIECGQDSACENAVFVVGDNVSIREFQCALDACYGCLIKHHMGEGGVPCDPEFFTRPTAAVTPAPTMPVTPNPTDPLVPAVPAPTVPGNGQFVPI